MDKRLGALDSLDRGRTCARVRLLRMGTAPPCRPRCIRTPVAGVRPGFINRMPSRTDKFFLFNQSDKRAAAEFSRRALLFNFASLPPSQLLS